MLVSMRDRIGRAAKDEPVESKISLPRKVNDQLATILEDRGLTLSDWVAIMARSYLRTPLEHSLKTILTYRKWAGEELETVIRLDPSYVRWLKRSVDNFRMDEQCEKLLSEIDPG